MALQHLKWEKSGRTFKTDKPDQFVYKSRVGQKNVKISEEEYLPYVWDSDKKIVKFADCEIRFQDRGLYFYRNGKRLFFSAFHLESKLLGNWKKEQYSKSELAVQEIKSERAIEQITISYNLINDKLDSGIEIVIGASDKVRFGFTTKAKVTGEYRLDWESDIVEQGKNIVQLDRETNEPFVIGRKFKDYFWRWKREESKDHKISDTSSKFNIRLNEKQYVENEEVILRPTTWGPTETSDDCYEENSPNGDYYDDFEGNVFVGENWGSMNIGWIWTNVTADGTANNGCKITIDDTGEGGAGCTANLQAVNNDTPDAWDATHYPSNATVHAGTVAWNSIGSGQNDVDSPEIKTIIQERFDGSHTSGKSLAIVWLDNGSGADDWNRCDAQSGGGTGAELTIDYTAAAAANPNQTQSIIMSSLFNFWPIGYLYGYYHACKGTPSRRDLGKLINPMNWRKKL